MSVKLEQVREKDEQKLDHQSNVQIQNVLGCLSKRLMFEIDVARCSLQTSL